MEGIRTDALYVGKQRHPHFPPGFGPDGYRLGDLPDRTPEEKEKRQAVRVAEDDLFENTFEAMHETEQSPKASAASETEAVSESEVTPRLKLSLNPKPPRKPKLPKKMRQARKAKKAKQTRQTKKDETAESEKRSFGPRKKWGEARGRLSFKACFI